jgi:hypothetical protein
VVACPSMDVALVTCLQVFQRMHETRLRAVAARGI